MTAGAARRTMRVQSPTPGCVPAPPAPGHAQRRERLGLRRHDVRHRGERRRLQVPRELQRLADLRERRHLLHGDGQLPRRQRRPRHRRLHLRGAVRERHAPRPSDRLEAPFRPADRRRGSPRHVHDRPRPIRRSGRLDGPVPLQRALLRRGRRLAPRTRGIPRDCAAESNERRSGGRGARVPSSPVRQQRQLWGQCYETCSATSSFPASALSTVTTDGGKLRLAIHTGPYQPLVAGLDCVELVVTDPATGRPSNGLNDRDDSMDARDGPRRVGHSRF